MTIRGTAPLMQGPSLGHHLRSRGAVCRALAASPLACLRRHEKSNCELTSPYFFGAARLRLLGQSFLQKAERKSGPEKRHRRWLAATSSGVGAGHLDINSL